MDLSDNIREQDQSSFDVMVLSDKLEDPIRLLFGDLASPWPLSPDVVFGDWGINMCSRSPFDLAEGLSAMLRCK